jgi:MFS family permease
MNDPVSDDRSARPARSSSQEERMQHLFDYIPQRRISVFDHLRPQRWNWYLVHRPMERTLVQQTPQPLTIRQTRNLRFFWLDGIFAATSESFYLAFIPLFALAYGATNQQVGWITAIGNLAGAAALFPGARLMEKTGNRKSIVLWSGGGIARVMLLLLAFVPLLSVPPTVAILLITVLNGIRAFMANFANPSWTAMVADIVPEFMRGRYFSMRNLTMGAATLVFSALAGWVIRTGNQWQADPLLGYQISFALAFAFGMVSTLQFAQLREPHTSQHDAQTRQTGSLREAIKSSPGYLGFVVSGFVWNFALQIAAPFFNVYLVTELGASVGLVGLFTSISSLASLGGQLIFGKVLDRRGSVFLQLATGFPIAVLPVMWVFYTEPWQVGINNLFGGFLWAGFNLANFNLLLQVTPDVGRARAVALYQTGVFASAFLGPLLGGYLADTVSFQLIFVLSGVGRALGMVLLLALTWLPMRRLQQRALRQS